MAEKLDRYKQKLDLIVETNKTLLVFMGLVFGALKMSEEVDFLTEILIVSSAGAALLSFMIVFRLRAVLLRMLRKTKQISFEDDLIWAQYMTIASMALLFGSLMTLTFI